MLTTAIVTKKTIFNMTRNFKIKFLGLAFIVTALGCGNNSNQENRNDNNTKSVEETSQAKKSNNIFDNPYVLTTALSKNGIGNLKDWSNPMDMGWGSLTDYYQFGAAKDGVGMQNNIAYYIEGTENKATKLYINLNINNPADKKNALKFLNEISEKTFKTLNITMPKDFSDAIINSKTFQMDIDGYSISNQIDKSKIETWKVNIERK